LNGYMSYAVIRKRHSGGRSSFFSLVTNNAPCVKHDDVILTRPSIDGTAKTVEDTERFLKNALPVTVKDGETKSHRIAYARTRVASPC
jgi:hypothetical protein